MTISQGKSDSMMKRFPLLLSLSAILFVFGVVSLALIISVMRIQHKKNELWQEQQIFDSSYKALVDRVMREEQATKQFAIGFDVESLQDYNHLVEQGSHGYHQLPVMQRFASVPGVSRSLSDFSMHYDSLNDMHVHVMALILHGVEIPKMVMPNFMQNYRLASNELKLNAHDKITFAQELLFDKDSKMLAEQVWEGLYGANEVAHRYFNDRRVLLSDRLDQRIMVLIALVVTMVMTVLISLWLKMTELDKLASRKR